jgi:hypothetical protein
VDSSQAFQTCVHESKNGAANDSFPQKVSIFVREFWVYRRCLGAYVIDKNAAITALGTLAVAIFTAILGGFTVSLSKSTRLTAKAAMDGALAAVAANKINRENSLADQRPWVGISNIKWDGFSFETHNEERVGATSDFSFDLKNFGKTPALDIFTHLKIGVRREGPSDDSNERNAFREELLARKSLTAGFAAFPTETETVKISSSITQPEIDAGIADVGFGKFINPYFLVGVGYTSANGGCFFTIAQCETGGILLYESGKNRPIHQVSTYAT